MEFRVRYGKIKVSVEGFVPQSLSKNVIAQVKSSIVLPMFTHNNSVSGVLPLIRVVCFICLCHVLTVRYFMY